MSRSLLLILGSTIFLCQLYSTKSQCGKEIIEKFMVLASFFSIFHHERHKTLKSLHHIWPFIWQLFDHYGLMNWSISHRKISKVCSYKSRIISVAHKLIYTSFKKNWNYNLKLFTVSNISPQVCDPLVSHGPRQNAMRVGCWKRD